MKSISVLGSLALGGSIASTIIMFTVERLWFRAGFGLLAFLLMIGWAISLKRRADAARKVELGRGSR